MRTAEKPTSTDKGKYILLTVGALVGLVASFLQTIEKLVLIENKDAILPCNINDVFSCSTVLSAPQSSLFGFPNSLLCMIIFTIFLVIGAVGLMGGKLTTRILNSVQALSLFMLTFALWFIFTSTYVIEAVCIFCLFCFAGLLMVNGTLWKLNASASSTGKTQELLRKVSDKNFDLLLWITLALILTCAIAIKFYV